MKTKIVHVKFVPWRVILCRYQHKMVCVIFQEPLIRLRSDFYTSSSLIGPIIWTRIYLFERIFRLKLIFELIFSKILIFFTTAGYKKNHKSLKNKNTSYIIVQIIGFGILELVSKDEPKRISGSWEITRTISKFVKKAKLRKSRKRVKYCVFCLNFLLEINPIA